MSWRVEPAAGLAGDITVPGDKSVTHRAYILGAMASGDTVVRHPLRAQDTDNTLEAVAALGVEIEDTGDTVLLSSAGAGSLAEPPDVLDLGNSGTGVRLMAGLLAGSPFFSVLTGDGSLRGRPMDRIAAPLRQLGAGVDGRCGGRFLPLTIRGGGLSAVEYESPVASAQVKSCVILAALQAEGRTRFAEPALSRDHTERMLAGMGAPLSRDGRWLIVEGGRLPEAGEITVPGDISSAAFFIVAAAVSHGSRLTIRNVGVNPTRSGILEMLTDMGADIEVSTLPSAGEPLADVTVNGNGGLRGVELTPERIPAVIDELPVAAVAAAFAEGVTRIRGAAELRVKESDRISTTVAMLRSAGVRVEEMDDGLDIHGGGPVRAAAYKSHGDHRLAMSAAVLSLMADGPSTVEDTRCVATSFPAFADLMSLISGGCLQTMEDDG